MLKDWRRIVAITATAIIWSSGAAGAQDSEPASGATVPAEFAGVIACGPEIRTGSHETIELDDPSNGPAVMWIDRGYAWAPPIQYMSDPRLQGTLYNSFDSISYGPDDERSFGTGTWRIVNDDGAWQGSFHSVRLNDGDSWASTMVPLHGEGDYAGLVALMAWDYSARGADDCIWEVRGVIVEGDLPAAPTAAS